MSLVTRLSHTLYDLPHEGSDPLSFPRMPIAMQYKGKWFATFCLLLAGLLSGVTVVLIICVGIAFCGFISWQRSRERYERTVRQFALLVENVANLVANMMSRAVSAPFPATAPLVEVSDSLRQQAENMRHNHILCLLAILDVDDPTVTSMINQLVELGSPAAILETALSRRELIYQLGCERRRSCVRYLIAPYGYDRKLVELIQAKALKLLRLEGLDTPDFWPA